MGGVRIVFKGLHDTFEQLLAFTLSTMAWWLGVILVVTAPPATLALFARTDPRIGTEMDRPTWGESLTYMRSHFFQAWGMAAITLPLIAVLVINIVTIRPGENDFGVLAPVWLFLLLIASFITMGAFAGVALLDFKAIDALKRSALLTAAYLPRVLIVAILLWLLIAFCAVLIVPLFLFVPSTVAATMNRFLLDALKIEVIDPLAPTDERRREEAARKASKFGP
jgi:uncharacterized membrane protein YesL